MVNFFIRRPIFATVSALLMLLIGGICAFQLPIAQYPQVAPPQVQVTQPQQPQVQVQPSQPQVLVQRPADTQPNVQVQRAEG